MNRNSCYKIIGILVFLVLTCPKSFSQSTPIHWQSGSEWKQIIQKAKQEKKYVFLDCYTTWCAPCVIMERDVFTAKDISDFVNKNFIAVKLQMDSTKKDNDLIKASYNTAKEIEKTYKVGKFPTFLFFTPDGQIIHRDVGGKSVKGLLEVLKSAIDSTKQLYASLRKYDNNQLAITQFPELIEQLRKVDQVDYSQKVAKKYVFDFLLKQPDSVKFQNKNIQMMATVIEGLGTEVFDIFFNNAKLINERIDWDGNYTEKLITEVIFKDEVESHFEKCRETKRVPDWNKLGKSIKKKYNQYYSERVLLKAKIQWFDELKDVDNYFKYFVAWIDKYGLEQTGPSANADLNNAAWTVFEKSTKLNELESAKRWAIASLLNNKTINGNGLDTYANIVYKIGKVEEAILFERIAAQLDPQNESIKATLDKMLKGLKTW